MNTNQLKDHTKTKIILRLTTTALLLSGAACSSPQEIESKPSPLKPFSASDYTIHFPKTGKKITTRFWSSQETNAPGFSCPQELLNLALTCRMRQDQLVFDAGHSDSPKSNRSDLETSKDPFAETNKALTGYIKPEFSDVTKASVRLPEEDFPARYSKPETHEGNFNMANTLMTKYFFDTCFIDKIPGQSVSVGRFSSSPIQLTRHPGETFYGEYAHPDWVAATAPPSISARQSTMPILSELRFEALTDYAPSVRINPSLGGSLISRNAYINFLLGSERPWAFRLASLEEENSGQPLSPAAYSVQNLRPGSVISFHSDTAPAAAPADPEQNRLYQQKFKDIRKRFLASKNDPAKVVALRDEWQDFFYNKLKLRSRDVSSLFIPTLAMPNSPPPNQHFRQGPNPSAPAFEPFFAKDIKDGINENLIPWAPFKEKGASAIITKNPIHLALLAGAVQTRNKVLVESIQLTGHAAAEMIRQVQKKDRKLIATAQLAEGIRTTEIHFSDGQILSARGQAIGLARALCR